MLDILISITFGGLHPCSFDYLVYGSYLIHLNELSHIYEARVSTAQ